MGFFILHKYGISIKLATTLSLVIVDFVNNNNYLKKKEKEKNIHT